MATLGLPARPSRDFLPLTCGLGSIAFGLSGTLFWDDPVGWRGVCGSPRHFSPAWLGCCFLSY